MAVVGMRSIASILLAAAVSTLAVGPLKPVRAMSAETTATTPAPPPTADAKDDDDDTPSAMDQAKTPEQRMQARFPQPIRVGDLIGQPLLDAEHSTIGYVSHVVRTPAGKIQLIISYRSWASWAQFLTSYDVHAVAVPIEYIGSMGPALSSIEMDRPSYATAPTWMPGKDQDIAANDVIQIAIARE